MNKSKIRDYLSGTDQGLFDQIENHELLGASNHIQVIGNMIENIALTNLNNEEKKKRITEVTAYYIKTRGEASHAIRNALKIMTNKLSSLDEMSPDFSDIIIREKNKYFSDVDENLRKILSYSVHLAENCQTILIYDYSSTVEKFIIQLSEDGRERMLIIPESRIINGGYPYVKTLHKVSGIKLKFIPDCSLFYCMKHVDMCFMGAETLYPDGTGFNTTGSDIVALICQYYHTPLYFITPMIKLYSQQLFGLKKKTVCQDLKDKLAKEWSGDIDIDNIDFETPELIGVPPEWISGFVTEYGVIPATQMLAVALQYIEEKMGETDE
ncbi:MAG: hypothetical protein Q4P30_00875 [Eubacteriales bacterium]|nr:hypothetical protein [Eubacteriales bacterium]